MNGSVLQKVDSFVDLGVTVSHGLSWGDHINSIITKCNQTMGMVKRSVGFRAPSSLKAKLFQSLVRSKLEYASVVWSPHLHSDIKSLETIQRSATRYIMNYPDMSYSERCAALQLLPLSFRREISDLLFMFKCANNLVNISLESYVSFVSTETNLRSANQGPLLRGQRVRTETFKYSFFNRIIPIWNHLPMDIRNCNTINSFKRALHDHYFNRMQVYDIDVPNTWTTSSLYI
jgi:hypothetical protein